MNSDKIAELRWRLILGMPPGESSPPDPSADDHDGAAEGAGGDWHKRERILSFLYDREYSQRRNTRTLQDRTGNLADSTPMVPDWINSMSELFPQAACERLERDALERYQIEDFLRNPDVLARAKPSTTLLRSILRTKHLMNQEVLKVARDMVRKVVKDLMESLAEQIRQPFKGSRDRRRRSPLKISQNFDPSYTIRHNLKHYNAERKQLVIEKPFFFSRIANRINKWRIIIAVDQSGSMLDSVILSAITASIFHALPFIDTHLFVFDTNIADLTAISMDPVETLMKVQMGGGTDIGKAMRYAQELVTEPDRTIVILITDFFEGAPESHLLSTCHKLLESRVKVLGLAALDRDCKPNYNRSLAGKLVKMGAEVGAMTPGELAAWVAEKIGVK